MELKELKGHTSSVNSVAFSRDGMQIVSGSDDNSVRVWDALTGVELKELKGHMGLVNSVAFSGDGTWIVSGSDDKSVRVWDLSMIAWNLADTNCLVRDKADLCGCHKKLDCLHLSIPSSFLALILSPLTFVSP